MVDGKHLNLVHVPMRKNTQCSIASLFIPHAFSLDAGRIHCRPDPYMHPFSHFACSPMPSLASASSLLLFGGLNFYPTKAKRQSLRLRGDMLPRLRAPSARGPDDDDLPPGGFRPHSRQSKTEPTEHAFLCSTSSLLQLDGGKHGAAVDPGYG